MKYLAVLALGASLLGTGASADQVAGPVIVQPADGATVTSPVTVEIGMNAGSMHAGMMPGAHLHLIIDSPLPAAGTTIPMDAKHIHLMHGESTKTLTLSPGTHTLQLIEGTMGHQVTADALHSDKVTIEVK